MSMEMPYEGLLTTLDRNIFDILQERTGLKAVGAAWVDARNEISILLEGN
jgi:hypothetical protein